MKVIFLDRDGVINQDRTDYVKSWEEFQFIPGSLEALRELTRAGYLIVVVTNQSVVNRNMVSQNRLQEIHSNMTSAVAAHGGNIEAVFYCPHAPDEGCSCRKPAPGLIRQAQEKYGFDLSETCMIGDSLKDIECSHRAGCGKTVLVRTGQGMETEEQCMQQGLAPDHVAEDLKGAVAWLLGESSRLKVES